MKLIDVLNSIEEYTRVNVLEVKKNTESSDDIYECIISGSVESLPYRAVTPHLERKVIKISASFGEIFITVK